jgi:hypothetical protein
MCSSILHLRPCPWYAGVGTGLAGAGDGVRELRQRFFVIFSQEGIQQIFLVVTANREEFDKERTQSGNQTLFLRFYKYGYSANTMNVFTFNKTPRGFVINNKHFLHRSFGYATHFGDIVLNIVIIKQRYGNVVMGKIEFKFNLVHSRDLSGLSKSKRFIPVVFYGQKAWNSR